VDLIDKQDVSLPKVGQNGGQVPRALDNGPGCHLDVDAHLCRNHISQRRFAQAGGTVQQDVIERLSTALGRLQCDREVRDDPLLPDILGQAARPQAGLQKALLILGAWRDDPIRHAAHLSLLLLPVPGMHPEQQKPIAARAPLAGRPRNHRPLVGANGRQQSCGHWEQEGCLIRRPTAA